MADTDWYTQLPEEFLEKLTCGSVFHVTAVTEFYRKRCLIFNVTFELDEGLGESFNLSFANDSKNGTVSIPEQVELLMMDINCAPTWPWHCSRDYAYSGEFAHYENMKCVRDSRAANFEPIL